MPAAVVGVVDEMLGAVLVVDAVETVGGTAVDAVTAAADGNVDEFQTFPGDVAASAASQQVSQFDSL